MSKPPSQVLHSVPDVQTALEWCEKQATADVYTAGNRAFSRKAPRDSGLNYFAAGVAAGALLAVAITRR